MAAGSTYTPIATTTLSTSQNTVTFSSIPQTYTDLVLVMNPISDTATNSFPYLRFNGDSGSNYSRTMIAGTGSVAESDRGSNESQGYFIYSTVVETNAAFNAILNINNYSNTTTNKTYLSRINVASGTRPRVEALVGLWRSTSAINQIVLYCGPNNFVSGSTFTLYGITAA